MKYWPVDGEIVNGRYTGAPCGIPCFQEGKVIRLNQWLENNEHNLEGAYFYSDSHNGSASTKNRRQSRCSKTLMKPWKPLPETRAGRF